MAPCCRHSKRKARSLCHTIGAHTYLQRGLERSASSSVSTTVVHRGDAGSHGRGLQAPAIRGTQSHAAAQAQLQTGWALAAVVKRRLLDETGTVTSLQHTPCRAGVCRGDGKHTYVRWSTQTFPERRGSSGAGSSCRVGWAGLARRAGGSGDVRTHGHTPICDRITDASSRKDVVNTHLFVHGTNVEVGRACCACQNAVPPILHCAAAFGSATPFAALLCPIDAVCWLLDDIKLSHFPICPLVPLSLSL